jgi:hypothetical protein
MQNNESDELEQLDRRIDSALKSYVDAPPSPNLEYRVIENIHRVADRKSRLWQWAIATPLLAASLLVVLHYSVPRPASVGAPSLRSKGGTDQSLAEKSAPRSLPGKGGPDESATTKVGAPSLRSKGGTDQSLAEKSTSPALRSKGWLTGTPPRSAATTSVLTLHDSALVAFARENPEQLQALFAKTNAPGPEPLAPVRIDDIEIKPIATEDLP